MIIYYSIIRMDLADHARGLLFASITVGSADGPYGLLLLHCHRSGRPPQRFIILVDDEERASARGKTNISRKLANPHRALWTTRQSNTCTTTLIFRVFCEVGRRALQGFYLNVGLFNVLY